jgi:uncharacterized membrane protein
MNDTVGAALPSRGRRAGWVVMTVLAVLIAAVSAPYLTLDPDAFLEQQRLVYLANQSPLLLHVGGGIVALVLGPWQFLAGLRARRPAVHRLIGRVYLLAVVAAGVGGLLLAPTALAGPAASYGFAALAVLLLVTSTAAFVTIRSRRVARHRVWVTRSYALIFAAVSFRLWLTVGTAVGMPFEQAYATGAWASWLINLLVAELLLARVTVGARSAAVV